MNPSADSAPVRPQLIPAGLPQRLAARSKRNFYNVFEAFDWDAPIPDGAYWMSPELLSVHGTPYARSLPEETLIALSKWETINLFSVFTQGESDLIQAIIDRIHLPFLEDCFEYLVHFIDEENKHMWFFAEFCRRQAGKIYEQRKIRTDAFENGAIRDFLAFIRIVIFEEMGERYNVRIMNDERIPVPIREIHRIHHQDESGHLSIGRELSLALFEKVASSVPGEELAKVVDYVEKYTLWIMQNIYNQSAYKDAGIPDAYGFRSALMREPGRRPLDTELLDRIKAKFEPVFRNRGNILIMGAV